MKTELSYAFPKKMRLSSRKEIESLFTGGQSFTMGPFRVFYRTFKVPEPDLLQPDLLRSDLLRSNLLRSDLLRSNLLRPDLLRSNLLRPDLLRPDLLRSDLLQPEKAGCSIALSVPKKHLKSAVKRNLIKRRLRESFRLHYPRLLKPTLEVTGTRLIFLCIYLPHEVKPYSWLETKMQALLGRFAQLSEKGFDVSPDPAG